MKRNLLIRISLGILLMIFGCSREEPKAPQFPLDVPDQVMENTTITFPPGSRPVTCATISIVLNVFICLTFSGETGNSTELKKCFAIQPLNR